MSNRQSPFSDDTIIFSRAAAEQIEVRYEETEIFVKRALRYLFIFDDIDSQDKYFRSLQWRILSGFDESSYRGKWLKEGDGYIKFLENGGARFSSRLPADCEEKDIVEIEAPPEAFSASLLGLVRKAFNKDSSLRSTFPRVSEVIHPQFLKSNNSLPNDFDVLIALDSILHGDDGIANENAFFIDITQKLIDFSREQEYLQFSNNAQTLAGLSAIKKIWIKMVEFLLASRERKVSVTEEMLGPIFVMFIKVIKTSLYKSEVTVTKAAALLMSNMLGVESDKDESRDSKETIGVLRTIATAIIFGAADELLNEAEGKLRAAKSEPDIEHFYDNIYLAYPYFLAARICFFILSESGVQDAKEPSKIKGNVAEEKAARISDSLLNSLFDLHGDMLTRHIEKILIADSEFDRNVQIFEVFDNRLLYPNSYKTMIAK